MYATFAEVANMAAHNIESSNLVFNWIENVREDLSKAIPCEGDEVTVVTGQGSCSVEVETVRDSLARRRKGWPPCQRKKSNKFSKSKMNSSRSNAKVLLKCIFNLLKVKIIYEINNAQCTFC